MYEPGEIRIFGRKPSRITLIHVEGVKRGILVLGSSSQAVATSLVSPTAFQRPHVSFHSWHPFFSPVSPRRLLAIRPAINQCAIGCRLHLSSYVVYVCCTVWKFRGKLASSSSNDPSVYRGSAGGRGGGEGVSGLLR